MRKAWDELSDEEVLALTPHEVEQYVDRACAAAGVPLLPEVPKLPEAPKADKDVIVYEAGGYTFTSRDDAATVADVINDRLNGTVELGYGKDYRHQYVRAGSAGQQPGAHVNERRVFSAAAWEQHGEALNAYDAVRREHDDARATRAKVQKRRDEVAEPIVGRVTRLREYVANVERWTAEEARYRDLGLEPDQARQALLLAHPEAEQFLPDLTPTLPGMEPDADGAGA